MCGAPSRISLEVRLIKAVPRDRSRLKQHFFTGYLCLLTGWGEGGVGGGGRCYMLMENNRLINTGETAGATGWFAFNQRPQKCRHDNFRFCWSFQVRTPPPVGGGRKTQVRLTSLGVLWLLIETDRER